VTAHVTLSERVPPSESKGLPRDRGGLLGEALLLVCGAAVLVFFSAGLLARCDAFASQRPSVAPSAWSLVGCGEGCDHADGTPAACLVAGRADFIALPVECPVA